MLLNERSEPEVWLDIHRLTVPLRSVAGSMDQVQIFDRCLTALNFSFIVVDLYVVTGLIQRFVAEKADSSRQFPQCLI
jgi:hypothetical protein